jgi:two-component system response regulator AtoC
MKNDNTLKIFLLESDPDYGLMLQQYLSLHPQFDVKYFDSSRDFFEHLHDKPDVVAFNYSMPDMDGHETLTRIRDRYPDMRVVVLASPEKENSVELLKNGAFDYIVKDGLTREKLCRSLSHLLEINKLHKEVDQLKEQLCKRYDFSKILIGESPAMEAVYARIDQAAKTNLTVTISGEKGTGKELVAKAIHYNSYRSKQPFVTVNVSGVSKQELERQLFGYEKGAFPGADAQQIGKIEEANNGTLFIDEVSELDFDLQGRLLEVLRTEQVTRIGGNEPAPMHVRFIVSTHKDLAEEVRQKRFREDLFHQLAGQAIELPPLRERGNDVLVMARYFVDQRCAANNLGNKSLSPEAQRVLLNYSFPGNVRELKSVMQLAVELCEGDTIQPEHINVHHASPINSFISEEKSLKEYEIQIIQHFLDKYDKDVLFVAKKLDIGKSTIYRMIQAGQLTR